MLEFIFKIYAYLFASNRFRKVNTFLYHLGLRGLGILNYQNECLTGEKAWLKKYLKGKSKPIVVDVGAHLGNYSKAVFSANKNSIVFAFEPHPKTYKRLISNVVSPNFKAFNLAVGSKNGILELFDYDPEGSSHASLYKDVIKVLHKREYISFPIEVVVLDDFLEKQGIQNIDLLKIDTEGNEFDVLLGCEKFLKDKRIKAIQFEFNEMNIISNVRFKDFWDYLKGYGYEFYRILPKGELLKIEKYSPLYCEIYAFQNIVAILESN